MVAVGADRQTAPEIVGLLILTREAQRCRRGVAEVGFTDGVEQTVIILLFVAETVGALIGTHYTATQGAAFVERAGGVNLAAVIIPTAGCTGERHLRGGCRAFAHHVDRCRRVAGTGHQAGRTTHDFNPVEHRQIRLHCHRVRLVRARQAVVHDVVDVETAGAVILPTRAAGLVEEQPRRAPHHIVDAGHALIIHALAGDDGHRLRRFAHGQRQFGRGLHRACGVGL